MQGLVAEVAGILLVAVFPVSGQGVGADGGEQGVGRGEPGRAATVQLYQFGFLRGGNAPAGGFPFGVGSQQGLGLGGGVRGVGRGDTLPFFQAEQQDVGLGCAGVGGIGRYAYGVVAVPEGAARGQGGYGVCAVGFRGDAAARSAAGIIRAAAGIVRISASTFAVHVLPEDERDVLRRVPALGADLTVHAEPLLVASREVVGGIGGKGSVAGVAVGLPAAVGGGHFDGERELLSAAGEGVETGGAPAVAGGCRRWLPRPCSHRRR